jgi:predicted Zn-dependent peptidase
MFGPRDTILSIAGNIDWPRLRDQVERLFGDWTGGNVEPLALRPARGGRLHLKKETAQTQIAVAYPSVPFGHNEYYVAQGAVQVLSGGMGSRLFTEVREKRGLCYSVHASYHTLLDRGAVFCYAGTSAERAQETLDVTMGELVRLRAGIEEHELARLKARIKSALIMQQESSSARSSALARDWYHLGRARTLDEVGRLIDELTAAGISAYLAEHPPRDFTVVTLGPSALEARE